MVEMGISFKALAMAKKYIKSEHLSFINISPQNSIIS